MRTMRRSLAPLGVLLFVGSSALWGQHPQVRKGFWIGFGIGYGPAQVSCDGCGSSSREGSFTGHVRLGGTLRPNLLLGADCPPRPTAPASASPSGRVTTSGSAATSR